MYSIKLIKLDFVMRDKHSKCLMPSVFALDFNTSAGNAVYLYLKDSTVEKRGQCYWIYDPCWCNMIQKSKNCHKEGIIISLQEVIKVPLKGNISVI